MEGVFKPSGADSTPARPPRAVPLTEGIPDELRALDRWVCWRWHRRDGKWRKVPTNPVKNRPASVTKPEDWSSYETAYARLAGKNPPDGLGIVLGDGLVGIDLDKCRDPGTGELTEDAAHLVRQLNSYAEVSPSGTGVKLFVRGDLPAAGGRRKNIEVYAAGRYFTVTGQRLPGAPGVVATCQVELDAIFRKVRPGVVLQPLSARPCGSMADRPDEAVAGHLEQGGAGLRFARLWAGDITDYTSASDADMALCGAIARLVGPDPGRIERVFTLCELAVREKWRKRADYRERTVATAVQVLDYAAGLTRTVQDSPRLTHGRAGAPAREEQAVDFEQAVTAAEALAVEQGVGVPVFRAVFDLARRLKRFGGEPHPLQEAVRAYCGRSGRDYDEVWLMMLDCWPWVKVAEGDGGWAWATRMARTNPIRCRPENGEKYELGASLAYWLSLLNAEFPFPVEKLGESIGMSTQMGMTVRKLLVRDKVIELVAKANHPARKAAEYRFIEQVSRPLAPPSA